MNANTEQVASLALDTDISTRTLAGRVLREQIVTFESQPSGRWLVPKIQNVFDIREGRHYHLFPELFIQVSGRSRMRFAHETVESGPGDVLLIPCGLPHEEYIAEGIGPFCNLVFMYMERHVHVHIGREARNCPQPRGERGEALECKLPTPPVRYLNDIADFSRYRPSGADTAIRGLFLAHWICLLHAVEDSSPNSTRESGKILQCRRLVGQRLADPQLSVKKLASWISCSPDYLSHCFHMETGERLSSYIAAQRIGQARRLLDNAAMNIGEVAQSCGFGDPAHFARVFRQRTGCTPMAWRKRDKTPV